jgi:RES domain-containing protein
LALSFDLLEYLQSLSSATFSGTAYRHIFGDRQPTLENSLGARWNPSGVAAIYTSLDRATAVAEGDHAIAVQPLRPSVARWIYPVHIELTDVLNLSPAGALEPTGVGEAELTSDDHSACRAVGEAVAWLGFEGLIVPSARGEGPNLVIFTANLKPQSVFDVGERESIS